MTKSPEISSKGLHLEENTRLSFYLKANIRGRVRDKRVGVVSQGTDTGLCQERSHMRQSIVKL